jgi:hypothetical protein
MIQNFLRLRSQPLGLDARGLATLELVPPSSAYRSGPARDALVRRLLDELRAVRGASTGVTTVNSLGGGSWVAQLIAEDAQSRDPNAIFTVNHRLITPGLLETMGIPLLRGRAFNDQDRDNTAGVAIVSARMAQRFWPEQDAIGKRVRVARPGTPWIMVVGVAGNVSDSHDPGVPIETWYRPFSQGAGTAAAEKMLAGASVLIGAAGVPACLVPALRALRLDPSVALRGD